MIDIKSRLKTISEKGQTRVRRVISGASSVETIIDGNEALIFCSNDYLGLANDPEIVTAFEKAARQYGVGSGSAHLVTGHSDEHHALEEELADFLGRERALLYSTGYMANMGIISALVDVNGAIFADKLNHASLIDGVKISGAKHIRYAHNDLDHLQKRYQKVRDDFQHNSSGLIVTDGVFSMDGDIAKLEGLAKISQDTSIPLMVDDAHGIGVLGDGGRGSTSLYNLDENQVEVLMGTFGKGLGTFGAFVAGKNDIIEVLLQTSRMYIYTTAIPPAIAAATRVSLKKVLHENWRRDQINDLISYFRQCATEIGVELSESQTPIQPLIIGSEHKAVRISDNLARKGIIVSAIRPPTVPSGTSRLRITLSASHTREHVDKLIDALKTEGLDED